MRENDKLRKKEVRTLFKNQYCKDIAIIISMTCIVGTAVLCEVGVIALPKWILQKTSDTDIYQTLFTAQASLVGVVIAVLSLMTNIIGAKMFGLSVTQYIMSIRPIKPFRHGWIIIELVVLTVINWIFVALNLNNLVVGLFIVTIVLLLHMILDVLSSIHSNQPLEAAIIKYLLVAKNYEHITKLFHEMNESIISGNAIILHRDIDFAKIFIRKYLTHDVAQEEMDKFQDLVLTLIHTANESQSYKIADILDLYVTIYKIANEAQGGGIVLRNMFSIEAYQLLRRMPINNLIGISGRDLLWRWQAAVLNNNTLEDKQTIYHDFNVASRLYSCAFKNNFEACEKVAIEILTDAQALLKNVQSPLENITIPLDAKEGNYIDLIITIFNEQNELLLKKIFGFDGGNIGFSFYPMQNRYGEFELTKVNAFIILFLYYLAYRENLAKPEEKEFCKASLEKLGQIFLRSVYKKTRQKDISDLPINEIYAFFNQKLCVYERNDEVSYGMTPVRTMIYEYVVLDFFSFSLTRLPISIELFEKLLKNMLTTKENGRKNEIFFAFDRYVIHDSFEDYKQFNSIAKEFNQLSAEKEYDKLKSVVTNLYREDALQEAEVNNTEFMSKQNESEKALNNAFVIADKEFRSQFIATSDNENPEYKLYTFTLRCSIVNGHLVVDAEEYCDLLMQKLYTIVFDTVKNKMKLSKASIDNAKVSAFLENIASIKKPSILFGFSNFAYDDPDYEKYEEIRKTSHQVSINGVRVNAAVDSQLIKIDLRDVTHTLRSLNESEILQAIEDDGALNVNGYVVDMDEQSAQRYLKNHYRIIETRFKIAVVCINDIVGGGLLFE